MDGSPTRSTPDGNFIYQDGQGNININATKDLNINVGENFNINVGKNLSFLVGLKSIYNIGVQMMMNTPILKYFVADNYHLQSPKTLINGDGEIKIEAKETNVAGTQKLLMHSDTTATVNSMGVVNVKGQDGTSHTNTPTSYEMARPEITAKCIVHFRPKKDWKGIGYGFDYMRKGDTSLIFGTADFGDVDYETIISKQYTDSTYTTLVTDGNKYNGAFKVDPTKFNLLKNTYNVHNIPWKAQKDSAGADLKDSAGNIIPEEYFCSWLSLYPSEEEAYDNTVSLANKSGKPVKISVNTGFENTSAVISLIVDIEEEPDLLKFETNEYFEISPKEINVKGKGKGKHAIADHITITCLKEFSNDQTLVVNAIKKDATGKEEILPAGKIMVWANNRRKKKKVVFVKVKISATDNAFYDVSSEKDRINNYLHQALIMLDDNSDIIELNVTDSSNSFSSFVDVSRKIKINNGTIDLDDYLKNKLSSLTGGVYNTYFKAFYFDELGDGLNGYSAFGADYVVVFGGANNQTASHEFLHSLNLPHTFDNAGGFTYEYAKTENLLDYSHRISGHENDRCSLWQWQWQIANNSIT